MCVSADEDCSMVPSMYICWVGHHFAEEDVILGLVICSVSGECNE